MKYTEEELRLYEARYFQFINNYFGKYNTAKLVDILTALAAMLGLPASHLKNAASKYLADEQTYGLAKEELIVLLYRYSSKSKREQFKELELSPNTYYKYASNDELQITHKLSNAEATAVADFINCMQDLSEMLRI